MNFEANFPARYSKKNKRQNNLLLKNVFFASRDFMRGFNKKNTGLNS
jgi:hypothetical protein